MTSINDAQRNSQADNAANDLATATLTIYAGAPPATAANEPSLNKHIYEAMLQ